MSKMKKDRTLSIIKYPSSVTQQKECSFVLKFNNSCDLLKVERVPIVKRNYRTASNYPPLASEDALNTRTEQKRGTRQAEKSELLILTDPLQTFLQVILKHYPLQIGHIKALKDCLTPYSSITILKLEYCNLTSLDAVRDLLLLNNNINDLSLNGNPGVKDVISKVIEDIHLYVLSTTSCRMDENDISLISKHLRESKLIALNLSSNNINDEGLNHLICVLRENRTLKCLNLADNDITVSGCIDLLTILRKFPLRHDEIVFRRRRNFQRLKQLSSLVDYYKLLQRSSIIKNNCLESNSVKKLLKKSRSNQINNKKSKRSSSIISKETTSTGSLNNNTIESFDDNYYKRLALRDVGGEDTHPFIADSYPENKMIYCVGNLTLQYLNLSYNKITSKCIEDLKQLYEYQMKMSHKLIHIKLDGNQLNADELDFLIRMMEPSSTTMKSSIAVRIKSSQI